MENLKIILFLSFIDVALMHGSMSKLIVEQKQLEANKHITRFLPFLLMYVLINAQ